ncbi:NUDIX domain-containing protein [bacterium]|nr:NUDIX domain-containing protein [bacterium]
MYLRNSAKAVIVKDDKILCIKCKDDWRFFYLLPGGGQEPGETLPDAVRRESREEVGADVVVHDLIFVRDYISANHEFAEYESEVHQVELMFSCELADGSKQEFGDLPDKDQIGIEWLDLDELESYRLYPMALRPFLIDRKFDCTTYIGDVN